VPAPPTLKPERVVLVGVSRTPGRAEVDDHLDELGQLAVSAGGSVVGRLVQEGGRLRPATLLRSGQIEALAALVSGQRADLIVFDDDLSPAQVKNLESALSRRVLDRSALILDIFMRRARSREARTQVELAQLRYLLPRLTRQWRHLSRQEGGIGQRGIGETQLELDRRLVRRRITRLTDDLRRIERERGERRKGRAALQRVALIGYTNAGKSTVMNLLTGGGARIEDRLFVTLDALVRRCDRGGRPPFLLIDTVGFIRKLPHHLVASFRSTLEEAGDAQLLVHVADASATNVEDQLDTTRRTLSDLGLADRPRLLVFNKIDRAGTAVVEQLRRHHPAALFVSALDPASADPLEGRIRSALGDLLVEETVSIPVEERGALERLFRSVRVIHSAVVDGHVEIRYRAWPSERARVSRLLHGLLT
jgi:GTPase